MAKGVDEKESEYVRAIESLIDLLLIPFIALAYVFSWILELIFLLARIRKMNNSVSGSTAIADNPFPEDVVSLLKEKNVSSIEEAIGLFKNYNRCIGKAFEDETDNKKEIDNKFYGRLYNIIKINKYVSFVNCVFSEDVTFELNGKDARLELSGCIILKKAVVRCSTDSTCICSADSKRIDIFECFINELIFKDDVAVCLLNNSINSLRTLITPQEIFEVQGNVITQYYPEKPVSYDDRILFTDNRFLGKFKIDEEIRKIEEPFEYVDKDFEKAIKKEFSKIKSNYYAAMIKNSDSKMDKHKYAKNLFLYKLNSAIGFRSRVWIIFTGGFCFPLVFLIHICIVVAAYGFFYYFSAKGTGNSITLLHAFYVSVLTQMTIQSDGPDHFTKIVAVIQAGTSILFSGGFLTAVINKYID